MLVMLGEFISFSPEHRDSTVSKYLFIEHQILISHSELSKWSFWSF